MAKNRPGNTGHVRIIGGQWRSRRLPIQDLEGLRPTTDRVRETLFNWLAGELTGARVLDCFGGSGALCLEALSRFAAYARVFELQRSAAMQLKTNLETLKCTQAEVVNGDTMTLLQQGPGSGVDQGFDIVFIDPPFRKGLASECIELLARHRWLNPGALIYLETESELADLPLPTNWLALKDKVAGQVRYRLYRCEGPG
jgi:16S rRNA (guanine966-N2)-methyltransferase